MSKSLSLGILSQLVGSKRDKSAKVTLVALLLPFLLFAIGGQIATAPKANALTACVSTGGTAAGEVTVTPSQGLVFYTDFGTTPKIDASYIGYRVTNLNASTRNLWVEVKNFAGDALTLASGSAQQNTLSGIAQNTTKTAYFLLKSSKSTSANAQTHDVYVYSSDPSRTTSPTILYSCTYTFSKVSDVIAASANKVTSVSINNTTPSLGDLITVTVVGDPGTIGSGDTRGGDADVIWLTPSAFSDFQTAAVRLENVSITVASTGAAGCSTTYTEQLLIRNAATCIKSDPYTITYKFRIISASTTLVKFVPIANISSGTQIKHTTVSGSASATLDLRNVKTDFAMKKEVVTAGSYTVLNVSGTNYLQVPYRITLSSTSTSGVSVDYVKDTVSNGVLFDTTTAATFVDVNFTTPTAISPTKTAGSAIDFYFNGPFTVSSSQSLVINYTMLVPNTNTSITYTNSANAYIGSSSVASSTAAPTVKVTPNGTTSLVVEVAPTAVTQPATSVATTTATINGTYTTSVANTSISFKWGTDPASLSDSATVTSTASADGSASYNLTGLTPGVKYYFQIIASNTAGTATGEILNFTTGLPVTNSATLIKSTTATINGTVSATAQTNFYWGTDSTLTTSTNIDLGSISASSPSSALTGLAPGTTYYFKICQGTSTPVCGEILSFTTEGPTATTVPATSVTTTTATINGTIGTGNGGSGTGTATTPKFYWSTTSDFTSDTSTVTITPNVTTDPSSVTYNLTGLTANTRYYYYVTATMGSLVATGQILSFITTSAAAPAPAPVVVPPVTITWPTPNNIQYPTPLGGTQLNAVALCNGQSVTGTYTYSPALGRILAPGTYTLTVTFTPTSGNCQGASTTVQLVVTAPAGPTITWPTPTPVSGPHTLAPAQLNAVCSVPGTLTYNPALGTVLQPGTYTLSVTCTPTDTNYPPVTTTVQLVVEKQYPKITWNDPQPIVVGVPLTGIQLNALFSVPGTCVYTPALNTVLPVGTHTLSVTCTPTNGNLYYPLTTTVKIDVLTLDKAAPAPLVIAGGGPSTIPVPQELQGSRSQIVTVGPCLASATIVGARITYTPGPGCSGKTYVTISTTTNGVTTITTIPITILVVAAPSKTGPITFTEGKIWWTKSPNAKSYEVTVWGTSVCSTTELSCNVTRTIGPKTPVVVIAKGNDGVTASSKAVYENKKPLIALNVYFDTAKFKIKPEGNTEINRVAKIIKKEGFTRLIIEGHTDSKGGINNQTLSDNRSKATSAALRKLLPTVSVKISGSAFKKPAAANTTPEGMALNRRSEVLVW